MVTDGAIDLFPESASALSGVTGTEVVGAHSEPIPSVGIISKKRGEDHLGLRDAGGIDRGDRAREGGIGGQAFGVRATVA
jgi:hypothetical protein